MAKAFITSEGNTSAIISVGLSLAEITLIEQALSDFEKLSDSQKSIFLGALRAGEDSVGEGVTKGERARLVSALCKGFASFRSNERMIEVLRFKLSEAVQTIVENDKHQLGLNLLEN